jgi:predicted nucleotidyltransferase
VEPDRRVSIRAAYEALLPAILEACRAHYGPRLVALAVFGSVGRGTPKPDSDIDLLVVAEPLPDGRMARAEEFRRVDAALGAALAHLGTQGLAPRLAPVFKTPAELRLGTPLLLDMTEDARVLSDEQGVLRGALERLKVRLNELGSRRIWLGDAWYWDLKPDYRPGDVFEL